jgi:nitroimidazol reductase NimA-like FMN-containing flavoprotein (pyridoxamine 5'-phosphate oxidase superfamily)
MDHWYCEADGAIYFHCAKAGHKIDAVTAYDKASDCVMDEGWRKEGEWALNIRSVIVFGRLRIVEDRAKALDMVRRLGLKYYPNAEDVEKEMQQAADRVLCLELTPEHITGKIVNES